MARWSSGQDASLSRWKHGFDSRTGHQKRKHPNKFGCFLFIQAADLAWHQCACALSGIAEGAWHHAQACIFSFLRLDSIQLCELIPFARVASNSIPQQVADSMHGYAVMWMRKENDMAKNLLLEYSEQLACEIAKLCNEHKIDSNTVYQIKKSSSSVFANISEAQYPQSLADMLSKFEIARKECMETESQLKSIYSARSVNEDAFKKYRNLCGRIRRKLTSSCITIENKLKQV